MNPIIESHRLKFVKITKDDFFELCEILQDIEVMYAWEHAFSDNEVSNWIEENLRRYETDGFSYYKAVTKKEGKTIGVIGPLMEHVEDKKYHGIGYILNKKYWNQGYAYEGAKACMEYSFQVLGADAVIAAIRPENTASRRVAVKLGMKEAGQFIRHYQGKDILHFIYRIEKTVRM